MFGLGAFEILIILFVALLFIGPKKLPELAKNLGKGIRDFQNAVKGISDPINNENHSKPEQKDDDQHKVTDTPRCDQDDPNVITTTAKKAGESDEGVVSDSTGSEELKKES